MNGGKKKPEEQKLLDLTRCVWYKCGLLSKLFTLVVRPIILVLAILIIFVSLPNVQLHVVEPCGFSQCWVFCVALS